MLPFLPFREPPPDETLQRSKTDTGIRSHSAPLEGAGIIGGKLPDIKIRKSFNCFFVKKLLKTDDNTNPGCIIKNNCLSHI